uniref:F5/8 type C domain-containing protein n=1 Tax=Curvibacter symbiont subsp. Hydra magnipapillata TaxID=667019 RepID=C9Y8W9_CURXX|nr:hypothetical protein Csp_A05700 [Curvibacter putative symbiont of Hydra magnipapillata]
MQDDGATRIAVAAANGYTTAVSGLAQALSFRAWSGLDAAGQKASNGLLVTAPAQTGVGTAFGELLNSATWVVTGAVAVSDVRLVQDSGVQGDGITRNPALTAPANVAWGVSVDYRWQKDGGNWSDWRSSYTPPATDGKADGAYTVQVRQRNAQGESATQSLAFVLDSQVAAPVVATQQLRYIRVYHSDAQTPLALSELKVMSGSTNLAAGKTATLSADSGYATHGANNTAALTDGGADGWWNGASGAGSNITVAGGSTKPYMELDLGALQNVDTIVLSSVADVFTKATNIRVYASASSMAGQTYSQLASNANVKSFDVANLMGLTSTWSGLGVAAQPMLSGTGEVGATVDIFDTAAVSVSNTSGQIGSAVVQSDGSWRWQASSIVSGSHTITTQQTDRAGNKSALSSGYSFTVNGTLMGTPALDAASDSGTLGDTTTNVTAPTLVGMGVSSGGSVEIYDNGSKVATVTATVSPSGPRWTYTPASSLASGVHSITAKDVGTGKTSAALALNIDTSAAAPSITAPAASITNVAPVISGTGAEAFATVTLMATPSSGAAAQTFITVADASGAWRLDTGINTVADASGAWRVDTGINTGSNGLNTALNTALVPNQLYTLRASQTDVAGNTSALSSAQAVNYDTLALAPTINPVPASVASMFTLSGTGEAGATVRVYDAQGGSTNTLGTATVQANGSWALLAQGLAAGAHSFRAEQTDLAGNRSGQTTALSSAGTTDVTVSTSALSAPMLTLASDSGVLGDGITKVTTPSWSGQAAAGATVEVWDSFNGVSSKVGSATANASGVWTLGATTSTLGEGKHSLVAKELAADGVTVRRTSDAAALTIDTTPLGVPTMGLTSSSDSGAVGDSVTNVVLPTLTGTVDANAWVNVYRGGSTLLGTAQANGSGVWRYTVGTVLADGTIGFTARQLDAAGNEGAASTVLNLSVDTDVSNTVRYLTLAKVSGNLGFYQRLQEIAVYTDNGKKLDLRALGGTALSNYGSVPGLIDGAGGDVTIDNPGSSLSWVRIDLTGFYRVSRIEVTVASDNPTRSNNYQVYGSSFDTGTGGGINYSASNPPSADARLKYLGTVNASTPGQTVVFDQTLQTLGVLNVTPLQSGAQGVAPAPVLQGSGEAGAKVEVFDTVAGIRSSLGSTTVQADGNWRWQASGIVSGSHTISVQQIDVAGNKSPVSSAYNFTVDSMLMGMPTLDAASDRGTLGDYTTNLTLPTFKGIALSVGDGSNAVQVWDNGKLLGNATIESDKTWSLTPGNPLASGVHSITVTDVAAGKTSNALALNIDTVCTVPVINAVADSASAPVVTGTGEAGATITLTATPADGTAVQTFTARVKADGTWSVDIGAVQGSQALVQGKAYTLFATATDVAGNTAAAAAVQHVLYDNVMNAQLQAADWRMDLASKGTLDAGDVLRLTFDQAVALTTASLPTAVLGTGALVAAVEPVAGKSRFWDVKLGTGQTLGGAAAGVTGSALAQAWALTGVSDAVGNAGTVNVGAGSLTALTAQVQAKQAPSWQVSMADVQDAGTLVQGWATPSASLKLNWGGQVTAAFTADAQGYWSYSFYKNESYFGRKVPQLGTDQTMSLLQVNADTSTTTLWSQTARVESTPQATAMALPAGATARPLSVQLAVRAGRSVALDVRDATQDMPAGTWQVRVAGLAAYHTLNRGSRDSAGVWTVDASDWADLRVNTTTNTVQEDRVLTLSYQQKQGSGPTATWVTQRQASVGLSVVPWVQIAAGVPTVDAQGFTQVQQVWNLGLKGLNGAGITIGIHEGTSIDINNVNNFELGNVLAGTYTTNGYYHGHRVGQRAVGNFDGPFVGIAYGANIRWYDAPLGMDVTNWSVSTGALDRWAWNDVDVTQRNGLGNVWAVAGSNYDGYMTALMRSTKGVTGITVTATDPVSGGWGGLSTGPGLWVAHPAWSTSEATPSVSGQAAMMLQANPGLGTRDVKNILALAATYYTTATPLDSFALNGARSLNGAGLHYSTYVGFGVSNVFNAVRLAADWLADGSAPKVMTNWQTNSATVATTPVSVAKTANTVTTVSVVVTDDVKLEALQIMCNINSDSFDKMRMVVTSPSGTQSVLANGTSAASFNDMLLMTSNAFFGESSRGTWKVSFEFNADATSAGAVSNLYLQLFGVVNEVNDKYVYTDQFGLHWQLADTRTRAQMGWLSDLNGGNDSLMLSAMNTDVQVHLGRHGWLTSPSYKVLMAPGTRIENAFGGDGSDVLVGLPNAKSILRGNEGNDLLLAYGSGSTLDGGNADDWLWLGGNTSATGGQGNDRFVVFQGEGTLTSTAAVRARMSDFDATQDSLMVYNTAGNFKLAQFDASGNLSGWAAVSNASVLQTLRSQLAQSDAPDVLGVAVSGSASAPTLTLTWDQSPLHPTGSTVGSYAGWKLNGVAPAAATLTGGSLSLGYSGVGTGTGVYVLDTSDSQLYSTLGVKLGYQKIYVGSAGADTVDASGQSAAVAVFGQGGSDVLTGGAGADLLVAAGLTAANVQVRMIGGQGADVFRLDMGIGNVGSGSVGGGSAGSGSASGRLQVSDFSLAQGDRLDLDALLQTIAHTQFVEDCVQISRQNNDAVLAFDLSGQKAFATSAFTVLLDNVYTQTTDITLRTLTYGSGMGAVLG